MPVLDPELLFLGLETLEETRQALAAVDPVLRRADEVQAHRDCEDHASVRSEKVAEDRHRIEIPFGRLRTAVAPGKPDVLDRRAVEDLLERTASQRTLEDVCLHELDARVVVIERARREVECDDVVPSLCGGKREKGDVGAEVQRRAGAVGELAKARRQFDKAVSLKIASRGLQPVRRVQRNAAGVGERPRSCLAHASSNRAAITHRLTIPRASAGLSACSLALAAVRIAVVDTYYPAFVADHYRRHPGLGSAGYEEQQAALMGRCFGTSDAYSHHLSELGHEAVDLAVNCFELQSAWSRERGNGSLIRLAGALPTRVGLAARLRFLHDVANAQIEKLDPEVVYLQDLWFFGREELDAFRAQGRFVVGRIASAPPDIELLR